jgi:hypothetical protein
MTQSALREDAQNNLDGEPACARPMTPRVELRRGGCRESTLVFAWMSRVVLHPRRTLSAMPSRGGCTEADPTALNQTSRNQTMN